MRGRLLIFCGIPGSGKTTVARLVAKEMPNAMHVQTDVVRSMLAKPTYDRLESELVYDICTAIAREALRQGRPVLLDGTFMREDYRSKARVALRGYFGRVDVVYLTCDLEEALKRNASRGALVPPEKVLGISGGFEPPKRAITVDTSLSSARETARRILMALR